MSLLLNKIIERDSPFSPSAYCIDVGFSFIEQTLQQLFADSAYGLELDPDFQRVHVWDRSRQIAFVEYMLLGGPSARTLYFACDGWGACNERGPVVLVDGKQRLQAVRLFMNGELPVFGAYLSEYRDKHLIRLGRGGSFRVHVADIDRIATLRWYLALNSGGVLHTPEELTKVEYLLAAES